MGGRGSVSVTRKRRKKYKGNMSNTNPQPASPSGGGGNDVSDVKSKTTPVSAEDKRILDGRDRGKYDSGYFQTSDSWDINEMLRNGIEPSDFTDLDLKMVAETMDKNMKPLNGDISVIRAVNNSYLKSIGINVRGEIIAGDKR